METLSTEYAPAASKKNLVLKAMPCGATVETDRKLLRRVMQNFISNAIKYTKSGPHSHGLPPQGAHLAH